MVLLFLYSVNYLGEKVPVHRVVEFFRGEHGEWKKQFAITAPSTRHKRLTELVGTGLFQAGRDSCPKER